MRIQAVSKNGVAWEFDSPAELDACTNLSEFEFVIVGTDYEILSVDTDFTAYFQGHEQHRLDVLARFDRLCREQRFCIEKGLDWPSE